MVSPAKKSAQALAVGDSVGYPYHPLRRARVRGFGGTSLHWELDVARGQNGWFARPLDAIDLEPRPGVPGSGWPFDRASLDRYYIRATQRAGIGTADFDAESRERETGRARLPLDPGLVTNRLFRLGVVNFGRELPAVVASENIRLLVHSTVTELVSAGRDDRVTSAVVRTSPGRSFEVRARTFVLATGGIENPRLLLLSSRARPAGLGNGHDLVGRYFMERLSARAGVFLAAQPNFRRRTALYERHEAVSGPGLAALALTESTIRAEGLLNAAFFVVPRPRAFTSEGVRSAVTLYRAMRRRPLLPGLRGHAFNVLRHPGDVARTGWAALRPDDRRRDAFVIAAQAEQAPNRDSRITLGTRTDPLGLPRPRLDWRLSDLDRSSLRRSQDILDGSFQAAGLGRLDLKIGDEDPPALFIGAYHHMGTTRMSADGASGVVDPDCRVHDTANVYVAGSSVFPTAGYANPTLTIVALAIRLADHIKGRMLSERSVDVWTTPEAQLSIPASGPTIRAAYADAQIMDDRSGQA